MQTTIPNAVVADSVPASPTLTFDQIHARVAASTPPRRSATPRKPQAVRAVYALGSLLADLDAADRAAVLALLRDEILSLPVTA